MRNFSRKAVFGGAAVITAATTAFMMAGATEAAAATPDVPAAHTLSAAQAAPTVPMSLSWPLVVQGNTGERVVAIQYLLNQQIGAGLATDGIFGPATATAVRNFQARFHIGVDGIVGPVTWNTLVVNEP
jgi:peptidoglycan hydrolase-like protein with peptidoglycan-binding domain